MQHLLAPRTLAALAGVFVSSAAVGPEAGADEAGNLYRNDTPAVLTPATVAEKDAWRSETPSAATREAFRRAYRRAGSPRLAVFWNRAFDDHLRETEAAGKVVVERNLAARNEKSGKPSTTREKEKWTISVENRRNSSRPQPLSEIATFKFQSGFLQPLMEAGAKVIDRAAIMRLTEARRALDDPAGGVTDQRLVETVALMDRADLLIRIALSPSDKSPTGAFFDVSILEVKSGRIVARFFNDATFEQGRKSWAAVRGGYIRITKGNNAAFANEGEGSWTAVRGGYVREDRDIDLERMGRVLAAQTMDALAHL